MIGSAFCLSQEKKEEQPRLQGIAYDSNPEMFKVTGIEVLGTPIGTDAYIQDFVAQNSIKIMRDVEKLEPLTDGFTHFQLVQKTMNTRTQYMSKNITLAPQEQFLSVQHIHIDTSISRNVLEVLSIIGPRMTNRGILDRLCHRLKTYFLSR